MRYNYTTSKEDQNETENLMQQAKIFPQFKHQKLKDLFSTVVAGTCSPYGKLVLSGQTLYGTTSSDSDSWGALGGAVFKVNIDGTRFAVLHHFPRVTYPNPTNSDGTGPMAGLILSGNTLYGTAPAGGAAGYGTVLQGRRRTAKISPCCTH